jgi:hypothetical protein
LLKEVRNYALFLKPATVGFFRSDAFLDLKPPDISGHALWLIGTRSQSDPTSLVA